MEPEKKSHGALIGSIIIIVILVIGGIYIWQTKVKEIKLQREKTEMQAQALQAASDKELQLLEQELQSADTNVNVDVNSLK